MGPDFWRELPELFGYIDARDVAPGVYKVRLRVDGIDSLLVDRSDPKALKFDPSQEITIT